MQKKLLYTLAFLGSIHIHAQFECPDLVTPVQDAIDVPVDVTITWEPVADVPSYLISLGTTPGGTDIVDNQPVGSPSFTPELGLPDNTDIYVTITLFFFNAENIPCASQMFRTTEVTTPPPCTTIATPANESANVSTIPFITWLQASTATGYKLSMGTQAGATDLLNEIIIEDKLSYEPDFELPFETQIFVSIIPYNKNGDALGACEVFSFTTQSELMPPSCTVLKSPADGEVNVPLNPSLEWDLVPDADGYRVSIGTTATENNILENGAYANNGTEVFDLLPNQTYYVTISPFNAAGDAFGCQQVSFTSVLGCGPIEDPITGEIVTYTPDITFPDEVSLCLNESQTPISLEGQADGVRWYKTNGDNSETLLSETDILYLTEEGLYRYEAYNFIVQLGETFECSTSAFFSVTSSELPKITSFDITTINGLRQIKVNTSGIGDYEYAINSENGPYQTTSIFQEVANGPQTIYVRDKNGCGITRKDVTEDLSLRNFPSFFSPNGDGINDYWQFIPTVDSEEINVESIQVFDRYGNFLKQIDPLSLGWDGNINGRSMPSSDYWFTAISLTTKEKIKGHFTLKR